MAPTARYSCVELDPSVFEIVRHLLVHLRQNAYANGLIGSIRTECIGHVVVFGERHLRHVLLSYQDYYNASRTHLSLNKDAPMSRAAETAGRIICHPILSGLHYRYGRI
jgi:hypothetical protein